MFSLLICLSWASRILAAFRGVTTVIEGICIFNIISSYKCVRVFKLLLYLGIKAYTAILLESLYNCYLLLLKGPSCLKATAIYRVFIKFLFRLSRDFKGGIVDINKLINKQSGLYSQLPFQ